jgi:cystathionine gamma-synthase
MRPATRIVWIETPSNPLLQCVDIAAAARRSRTRAARARSCDNTFASPALQRPLELGCDLVMHATTKYLGGRSDVLGGAVVARADDAAFARSARAALRRRGAVAVRLLARHAQPADAAGAHADALRERAPRRRLPARPSEVSAVHYPGLSAVPSTRWRDARCATSAACCRSRCGRQGRGDGGRRAVESSRGATSLGGVESLIEHRASIEGPREPHAAGAAARLGRARAPDDLIDDPGARRLERAAMTTTAPRGALAARALALVVVAQWLGTSLWFSPSGAADG